jgi:hypothetical protein
VKDKPRIFEWVAFVVFILLEIGLFTLGILHPSTREDQTQNILYNTFEIAFSLYIGYFIQRLDSIRQFRESLKQYALSAYRRIMDIRKSIDRTIVQIGKIGVNYPKDKTSDLDALRLILEGTFDTVESSIADWSEIIGQEIRKKEEAELLQERIMKTQDRAALNEEDTKALAELRSELNRINAELPSVLRNESDLIQKLRMADQLLYSHHFEYAINRDKCLRLYVKPISDTPKDLGAPSNQPFSVGIPNWAAGVCFLYNKDRKAIGMITDSVAPQLAKQEHFFVELFTAVRELGVPATDWEFPVYVLHNLRYVGTTADGSLLTFQLPIDEFTVYAPRG